MYDDHRMPDVIKRIRTEMSLKRINGTKLAAATGIDYQALHRILNGRKPVFLDDAVKIAAALRTTVDELVDMEVCSDG